MSPSTEPLPPRGSPGSIMRQRVRAAAARALGTQEPTARRSSGTVGYSRAVLIALAAIGIAIVAGLIFRAILLPLPPFVTIYPGVAVAAWAGGLRAGLIATGLSAVGGGYLFVAPPLAWSAESLVVVAVFGLGGLLISILGGHLHRARARAEAAADRAEFLAEASRILSTSLNPLDAVEALTRIAVPHFADWCTIDLADDEGRPSTVRIAHPDPALVALGYRLRREYPINPDDDRGAGAVIRTGRVEYLPVMPPEATSSIGDPRLRDIITQLDLRSYLCVPLLSPRGNLGALSAFMSTSGRHFTADDLAVAEDLGRRMGVALDHARLFRRLGVRSRELDEVIATIRDGVIVADTHGTIRSRNAAAEQLVGGADTLRSLDDVMARLRPDDGLEDVFRSPETGRAVRVTSVDVDAEGEQSRIMLLRDITEILETEAARNAFIGMLSHELRTPVTTIYGNAAVLQRNGSTEADREVLIADLAAESDRLYRLVEDLLVLSRFERGALEVAPEPVLIQRILPPIARLEERRSPGLVVDVDVEPDLPAAHGDETYIGQVVRNLLSNAAKYGGMPGRVTVRAAADGDTVTIEVEDSGPGIPEGEEERVFDLYERGPAANRMGAPGAGVGLFVARRLAELMGGRIVAGRGERDGARFTISLPVYESDPANEVASAAPAQG
jgi:K+-sensing histidine kinase KdpD